MTAIQFYHLTATPLERALPKLLEKAYAGGFKTLLVAGSDEQVEQLNQLLWTYDPNSFLPHGGVKDGNSDKQPILIVTPSYLSSPACGGGQGGGVSPPAHGVIGEGEHSSRQPEALAHAKELRKNATDAENKLWYSLQKGNMGCSFRRQHPVGPYIADFACIEKKLVIELDGGQHGERQDYDEQRSAFLHQAGYNVLRFWNNEVLGNMEGVLQVIAERLGQVESHPPSPPASGGVRNNDFPAGGGLKRLLLVTDGSQPPEPEAFARILDIFDGRDAEAVARARARWQQYKQAGHALTYLKQTEQGGWEQKAAA